MGLPNGIKPILRQLVRTAYNEGGAGPTLERRPRIAFSGSAGIGKTTLAQAMAERLQVPYVDEGMRRRLEAGLDLHTLTREQHRDLLLELADEAQQSLEEALRDAGGVVADRSPLDALAFWLHYGFLHDEEVSTEAIIERQLQRCRCFDLIVILPWGVLPLRSDGVRSTNPWLQLQFHALAIGLAQQFLRPEQLISLPKALTGLQDRIDWMLAKLSLIEGRGMEDAR